MALAEALGVCDSGGAAPAELLLRSARALLPVRTALRAGDWRAVRAAVGAALRSELSDACRAELR